MWRRRLLYPGLLVALCAAAAAQNETPAPVPAPTPPAKPAEPSTDRLTLESAQRQLAAFQQLTGQDELKAKVVPILSQAVRFLEDEQRLAAEAERFRVDPPQIAQRVEEIREDLNARRDDPSQTVAALRDLDAIRQRLAEVRQQLIDDQSKSTALEVRMRSREERIKAIPQEKIETEKRLNELRQPLPAPPEGEPPEMTAARQMLHAAEQQMLLRRQNVLNLEPAFYDATVTLRTLERQQLQRDLAYRQRLAEALQKRQAEAEQSEAATSADDALQAIADVPEELASLANEVAATAQRRRAIDSPLNEALRLKRDLDDSMALLELLRKERGETQARLTGSRSEETIGEIINQQRAQLPSLYKYEQSVVSHTRAVTEARQRKHELDAEIDRLTDLDEHVDRVLRELKLDDASWLEADVRLLLQKKREFLTSIAADHENHRNVANDLARTESEIVRFLVEYEDYLNSISMWVVVSGVYSADDLNRAARAIPMCLRWSEWRDLSQSLYREVLRNPLNALLWFAAAVAYLGFHGRLKRRIAEATVEVSQGMLAPFHHTRDAFIVTVILAVWLPVLLALVGDRLSAVPSDTGFVPGVGRGLVACAYLIGVLRVIQYVVRANGLGEVHFRWSRDYTARVRLHLRWFMLTIIPITFFDILAGAILPDDARDALGRLLLIAGLLLAALFLYRVLAPERSRDERSSPVRLNLWQKIVTYGPSLIPLAVAVMSFAGYTYTAVVLTERLMASVGVLLVLVLINELAYRWLYIARGRLALEQARKRQEAREAAAAMAEELQGDTSEIPKGFDPKSAGIDLSQINLQTRQLLNTTFHLLVFAALWTIWHDVMPPIGVLDRGVWQTSQLVEAAKAATGSTAAAGEAVPGLVNRWVTIGDLLLFGLVFVITIVASKNLPGLLEITVLQNLPLDTGIRYAAGILARYCLVAFGMVVATGILGIGITQVSILLGGLAIGLGFGLQELFANFVSGLILLFEQPLRIGDIVTVGNVSGTVTRIRIRATTITDWDRKEYIVPNKEFITGHFMNWTLSDAVNRIQIAVGVAYGSDTERARGLLLKVCDQHPLVLKDPVPSAVFDAFGDSALNLTLRCFLPNLENRLAVIHDLHTGIDRAFKRAGIEIAFPQMDLHLRSVSPGLAPLPFSSVSEGRAGRKENA